MPVQSLDHYGMSAERGFLCCHNADDTQLSGAWGEAAVVALRLPQLLPSGRLRQHLLSHLPTGNGPAAVATLSDTEARKAMVHYSFMVQAWVWGEPEAPSSLPECLAVPIDALAERLGQQPLLPYSGYVLDNWGLLDRDAPVGIDNTYVLQHFLGGQDEAWFVLIHVAIEARAGAALNAMRSVIEAADLGDQSVTQKDLIAMASVWTDINLIFDRMPERCDPYIYFERVRPYIHGWRDNPALPNGLIYEGVERYLGEGQAFRGQTGSQSSIVPAIDALLGIGHAADPLREYLDQLHIYRPPAHRAFIDDVRRSSNLRSFVEGAGSTALTHAYNANVQAIADFRTRHLEYAASYIHKQNRGASGNDTDVGTGGTPFMKYLKKHRNETRENLIVI